MQSLVNSKFYFVCYSIHEFGIERTFFKLDQIRLKEYNNSDKAKKALASKLYKNVKKKKLFKKNLILIGIKCF